MTPTRPAIDRILCPVDFSEFSAPALERAIRMANWCNARVEVMHVLPLVPLVGPPQHALRAVWDTGARSCRAAEEMAALVAGWLDEGVALETKILEGEPWRVIVEEAERHPTGMVVMGTHGRSGFEHLLLGSVTEKVLRRTTCPVMTVSHLLEQPRVGPPFRKILCAADLTPASERTLQTALSLAGESRSQVVALHVIASLPGEVEARPFFGVPEIASLRVTLLEQARAQLRESMPAPAHRFCEINARVGTGTPWSEILRVASAMDADLIVMGAHTRGAAGRLLFGSTANEVVRRAPCPVMIVRDTVAERAPGEARAASGRLSLA